MEELQEPQIVHRLQLQKRHSSGAAWFYWIAGLSIVNLVIAVSKGDVSFIVGLGITQIFTAIAMSLIGEIGNIAYAFAIIPSVMVAGMFVVFGIFAKKGYLWAFIVGMILYALDGLLFLLVQDWFSLGFHAFALYWIFNGMQAMRELEKLPVPTMAEETAEPESETIG